MALDIFKRIADLGSVFSRGPQLGIDIGTGAVKIAEIGGKASEPELLNYGQLMRSSALRAIHDPAKTADSDTMESRVADHIRDLRDTMQTSTKRAVMALPSASGTFELLHFPKMHGKNLHDAVLYQVERLISAPLAELVVDWEVVGETEGDEENAPEVQVLVAAIPRDVVDRYVRIAKRAGLQLVALEAEPFALVRAANRLHAGDVYGILDFGGFRSTLTIVEHAKVHAVKELEMTGSQLTMSLANSLVVDEERAEAMKVQYGLTATDGADLGRTLGPFVDGMIGEIRSGLSEYVRTTNHMIEALYLCGGASRMKGFAERVADQFEVTVSPLASLRDMEMPTAVEPHAPQAGVTYALAVGLALRHGSDGQHEEKK